MKKIPLRRCLATNQSYPKQELFRVVRTPSNEVILDISGKANGRGAYIYMNEEAIQKAKKTNCLGKALECEIPETIYERMSIYLKMK